MSVMRLVSIPGMMTGQIWVAAARYQMMIMKDLISKKEPGGGFFAIIWNSVKYWSNLVYSTVNQAGWSRLTDNKDLVKNAWSKAGIDACFLGPMFTQAMKLYLEKKLFPEDEDKALAEQVLAGTEDPHPLDGREDDEDAALAKMRDGLQMVIAGPVQVVITTLYRCICCDDGEMDVDPPTPRKRSQQGRDHTHGHNNGTPDSRAPLLIPSPGIGPPKIRSLDDEGEGVESSDPSLQTLIPFAAYIPPPVAGAMRPQ
eukprot:gene31518-6700_t